MGSCPTGKGSWKLRSKTLYESPLDAAGDNRWMTLRHTAVITVTEKAQLLHTFTPNIATIQKLSWNIYEMPRGKYRIILAI